MHNFFISKLITRSSDSFSSFKYLPANPRCLPPGFVQANNSALHLDFTHRLLCSVGINWLNIDLGTQELKMKKAMFFLIFQVHEDIQNTFISWTVFMKLSAKMVLLTSVVWGKFAWHRARKRMKIPKSCLSWEKCKTSGKALGWYKLCISPTSRGVWMSVFLNVVQKHYTETTKQEAEVWMINSDHHFIKHPC